MELALDVDQATDLATFLATLDEYGITLSGLVTFPSGVTLPVGADEQKHNRVIVCTAPTDSRSAARTKGSADCTYVRRLDDHNPPRFQVRNSIVDDWPDTCYYFTPGEMKDLVDDVQQLLEGM